MLFSHVKHHHQQIGPKLGGYTKNMSVYLNYNHFEDDAFLPSGGV